MSVTYDWDWGYTGEPFPGDSDGGGSSSGWRARLRWFFIAGVLLLAAGWALRAWGSRRLEAVHRVENELRSVVELELQAIRQGDAELFGLVQDPYICNWRERQLDRYFPDANWDSVPSTRGSTPSARVLAPAPSLVPAERGPDIEQVYVVGSRARVRLTYWFQPAPGAQASFPQAYAAPWPFQVTWFYRWDYPGAWYRTAPPDDYVGERQKWETPQGWGAPYPWRVPRVGLSANEADAELLDAVAPQVFELVHDACQLLDCSALPRYVLSLNEHVSTPDFGIIVSDLSAYSRDGIVWRLPALYLSGQAQGQVARAAWMQAFKLLAVEALPSSLVIGGDRQDSLFFRESGVQDRVFYIRLVTRLQAELGLIEPPAPSVAALTQALTASSDYSLRYLWQAEYDPNADQANRLLEVKVDALLRWIEEQVGVKRTLELLLELHKYKDPYATLRSFYGLTAIDLEHEWSAYLQRVTGLASLPLPAPAPPYQALPEPPAPPPLSFVPGNQLAFICDGRVWVADADGSGLAPLTAAGENFTYPYWSPDGRWLLSAWMRDGGDDALYLLASDGSGGRLLTDQPSRDVSPCGWSPDSSQVVYHVSERIHSRHYVLGLEADVRVTSLEGGNEHLLIVPPLWSPDGQLIASDQLNSNWDNDVWLADADLTNWRVIARQARLGTPAWSPDSSQLALIPDGAGPNQGGVLLYDLATGNLKPLIALAEATEIVSSALQAASDGDFIGSNIDPSTLHDHPFQDLQPWGWSADGSRLVVSAEVDCYDVSPKSPLALLSVPLDGSPPRVLAFTRGNCSRRVAWSPTDPHRLLFGWSSAASTSRDFTYLFDLDAGPVYKSTQGRFAAWSPDGERVAFAGDDLTVVDQQGRVRFSLDDGVCTFVAWNPRADLSAPTRTWPAR